MHKKVLTSQQKDSLAQAIIDRYERDPASVEKLFPEAAQMLGNAGFRSTRQNAGNRSPLTETERGKRLQSLNRALEYMKLTKGLSTKQAIQALEDIAALVEASPWEPPPVTKKDIATLLKAAACLSLSRKGKAQKVVLQEGEPCREVLLLRGVKLELTWDKKLLSIEIEPKELAIRAKALSIIGIGPDTATDVAERHDNYYVEALSDR